MAGSAWPTMMAAHESCGPRPRRSASGSAVSPRGPSSLRAHAPALTTVVVARFSRLAPAALVTVVATGTLRALAELAVPRQLVRHRPGRTILLKRRRRLGLALAIVLAAAL